jgi:DNA polymerase-1
MKLAVVFPAPLTRGDPLVVGIGGTYFSRTLEACAAAANVRDLDARSFFAISSPLPGGKPPSIAAIRAERDRLREEIVAWNPDAILSVSAPSLNAVSDDVKALAISKMRGCMQWAYGMYPWVPTISNVAVALHADLHRDFSADVFKVLSQSEPMPPMRIDVLVPQSLDQLRDALSLIDDASVVGVDVETTGLSPHRNGLLAVGFGAVYDDEEGLAVVVTKELLRYAPVGDILWDAVWRKSRRSVGHNFKFDMQFMVPHIGWAPDEALIGDTLLMAHLLDERPNRPTSRVRGLGLKDLVAVRYDHQYGFDFKDFYEETAEAHEGESEDEFHERVEQMFDDMHTYLAQDVCYTARLWHDLTQAEEEGPAMLKVHDRLLMPVSRSIAKLELGGAPVDVPWIKETVRMFDGRIARRKEALEKQLAVLTRGSRVNVNIKLPAVIADIMYDDWKMTPDVRKHGRSVSGDRSTDKDHIKAAVSKYLGTHLDREARWLRALQSLRREIRQRTTYQKSLLDRVDDDGRVRPSFLIHGTATGRLSAQGPAIQTIPAINREDSLQFRPMRRAFRPQPGWQWVEVDYSQLELRVAAAISEDQDFADVFRSGRDVHREIASSIFSKEPDQISDAERFLAKAVAFGIIYGRGGEALATGAEMRYAEQKLGMKPWTPEQATAFIKKFRHEYPILDEWMNRMYAETPKRGYVESPFGRRRRFPLYPQHKGELGSIQRQAVNTPVQSAASDICLEAMVEIQKLLSGIHARVLFPVHDSICLEVEDGSVDLVEEICRLAMEKEFMGVPLTVDFEVGPTWADVEKVKA